MTESWELAEINIAQLRARLDDPTTSDFVVALIEVAERSTQASGLQWKQGLIPIGHDAALIAKHLGSTDWLVQLSVWDGIDTLKAFVYRDDKHASAYRRRTEWTVPIDERHYALWWVPSGHRPTNDEAFNRLHYLREHGPSSEAFTFAHPFAVPD